jgi:hypothetical protein
MASCGLCDTNAIHPLYVYVAEAKVLTKSGDEETRIVVGADQNPIKRESELNRKPGFVAAGKNTRLGSPNWRCKMVIGPFPNGKANSFKQTLKDMHLKKDFHDTVLAETWKFNSHEKPSRLLGVYCATT